MFKHHLQQNKKNIPGSPPPPPRCVDLFIKEQLGNILFLISRIRLYTWTLLASSNRRHIVQAEQITRESKDDILKRFCSVTLEAT